VSGTENRTRGVVGLVLIAAAVVNLIAPAAGATKRPNARQTANDIVNDYLSYPLSPSLCTTRAAAGWLFNHRVYRASCTSSDGKFEFIVYVNADGKFNAQAVMANAERDVRSHGFCLTGGGPLNAALTVGIKGKLREVHAGSVERGGAADVAYSRAVRTYQKKVGYESEPLCSGSFQR